MHTTTLFSRSGKLLVGLAFILMPVAYSCNNTNGDASKKDSSTVAPMADSSTMHTDTAMKPADTGHRGDQPPPPPPHHP